MDPIVSDLWGCPLNLDGCYVSRGKTTPTLHFLCLHGSHAIDAVSMPSSLMLSTTVESRGRRYASGAPVLQLATEMDGGKKAARSEQSARCSIFTPSARTRPTLTLRTSWTTASRVDLEAGNFKGDVLK